MKQKSNCLAPGAGGGGGVGAPFSKRDALSSAGLGDVSRAVMLPLRALMYYCGWLGSSSGRWSLVVFFASSALHCLVNCFRRAVVDVTRRRASDG